MEIDTKEMIEESKKEYERIKILIMKKTKSLLLRVLPSTVLTEPINGLYSLKWHTIPPVYYEIYHLCKYTIQCFLNQNNIESLWKVVQFILKKWDYFSDKIYLVVLIKHLLDCRMQIPFELELFMIKSYDLTAIKQLVNVGLKINENYLLEVCKSNRIDVIEYFIDIGIKPTSECLIMACKQYNIELMTLFLSKNKELSLTYECFIEFLKTTKHSLYQYKSIDTHMSTKCKMVEFFLLNGYKLTYFDLQQASKCGYKLENMRKYNDSFLKCLEYECTIPDNYLAILDLVVRYKITPNSKCLENACTLQDNCSMVEFLMQNKAKITKKCIENLARAYGIEEIDLLLEKINISVK